MLTQPLKRVGLTAIAVSRMAERRTVLFSGEVQGVGFRATARRFAAGRPLAGYVRNLADGRVELVAEGEAAAIDGLVVALRDHFGHMVQNTSSSSAPPGEDLVGFTIRH